MFFFLQQLSLSDLLQSMDIAPILLRTVINEGAKISLIGCIVQFYFFGVAESLQCLLLTVMSYDRYLAICNPLCYSSIMNHKLCVKLILMSWLLTLSFTPVIVIYVATQEFCNQNTINHFFCDYFPLLELSCSEATLGWILAMAVSVPVILFPFLLITVSYICIAHEILKITSNIGRQKAFSTCSSHLAVVSIFYGSLFVTYVVPTRNQSQTIGKLLSLLYTVVTPFINPLIYSLKSTHIKKALKNIQ
ncbi:olfactory receptor 5G3-like [Xenopus laevis]|nr:olfactory receptor 5G3-like [Xenopus laevis]